VDAYVQKKDAAQKNGGSITDLEVVKPLVRFDSCVQAFLSEEQVGATASIAVALFNEFNYFLRY
jgi:hypothetical protein